MGKGIARGRREVAKMNGDHRKGELAEIKGQLRQLAGSRAPGVEDAKRELYKKVISYLTVGIDVSSLFSEMVMCSATSDLVLKKMCYLYVGNYARGHPDLALLTINFLQKDCQDDDPMIRGLALRSLCSLRVKNLVEYLVGPLRSGLKDRNGYVRSVAAMGALKLYHIAPSACTENDFPATLKTLLLDDSDPQVVANCLYSLLEILSLEGNTSEAAMREKESLLHQHVIHSLLNRLKEFSEWAQCLVLEVVAKYVPADSQETDDMMDVLDDRLQHANSAVVLATIKVFLHLTMSMADVHQKVYERIRAPLLTLVSSGSAEQSYAVLSHLHLLVMRAPMLFASDYKHFYCRYSDPSYVKKLKLEMLTAVANESNTYDIVTELSEYAANVDVTIARESIRAVGKIALQQYDVNAIVDRLLQFLEMEKDYVTAETLVLVKDLLRKYPQWSHDCIAVVGGVSSKSVQEPKAKSALVWMLGEYAYDMLDAPYVLEGFVQNWAEEEFIEVRLELLTAAAKCFFKRPPETLTVLGAALTHGLADANQDVHDRALLYYRLLQHSVEVAERVINPPKQAVSVFAGSQSTEVKDRIFDDFNSLAVVYRQPSYMFLNKEHRSPFSFTDDTGSSIVGASSPGIDLTGEQIDDGRDNGLLLGSSDKEESQSMLSNGSHAYGTTDYLGLDNFASSHPAGGGIVPSQPAPSASSPLLAVDDLLGLGSSLSISSPPPSLPQLALNQKPVLDASTFKRKWAQLSVALTLEYTFPPAALAGFAGTQPLVRHMQANSVQCMASGQAPLKFFFFAQMADAPSSGMGFFLVELLVTTSTGLAHAKIKADDATLAPSFADTLQSALSRFGPTY